MFIKIKLLGLTFFFARVSHAVPLNTIYFGYAWKNIFTLFSKIKFTLFIYINK